MRDIPMFTTEYGVSSLMLKEIPYKQLAFIYVLDVQPGQLREHLSECIGFCRGAGAERILAKGHCELEQFPLHSIVYQMSLVHDRQKPEAMIFPVTDRDIGKWREIYNKGMATVDNHATLTAFDEKQILASGGAYFVHRNGNLLGIGWMEGGELLAIVSTVPGMGETVARTLFSITDSDRITLQVVSTNERAIRLYEKLGFVKTAEISKWYRVL